MARRLGSSRTLVLRTRFEGHLDRRYNAFSLWMLWSYWTSENLNIRCVFDLVTRRDVQKLTKQHNARVWTQPRTCPYRFSSQSMKREILVTKILSVDFLSTEQFRSYRNICVLLLGVQKLAGQQKCKSSNPTKVIPR